MKDCGPFTAVFTYEEILEKEDEVARLFELFGGKMFDESWRKADSQENTYFSREHLKKIEAGSFEIKEDMVHFLQLPRTDSSLNDFKEFIING